jgi:hypothetical protein
MHKSESGLERSLKPVVRTTVELTRLVGLVLRHRSTGLGGARNAAKDRRLCSMAHEELQVVRHKLDLLEAYLDGYMPPKL